MISKDSLTIDTIKDLHIFNSLYKDWLRLYNKCKDAVPFQSPDWLLPWWNIFGSGQQLNVLEIRCNGNLCCLAPFYVHYNTENNKKELKFIGTGNSDYLDILVEEDMIIPCINMIYNYLIENKTGWDYSYLQGLQKHSPFFSARIPDQLEQKIVKTEICPVLVMPGSSDKIITSKQIEKLLSKKFLKYLIRNKRILNKAGILELETADEKSINSYLTELFILHKDRWGLKNKPGVLGESSLQAFHYEAVNNLLLNKSIRLYRLIHNNLTVAMLYALIKEKTMYNYIGAFNTDYKKFSPGSILLLAVLEDCVDLGIEEFNMLNGAEDYKYRWGAADKTNYTIMINHK